MFHLVIFNGSMSTPQTFDKQPDAVNAVFKLATERRDGYRAVLKHDQPTQSTKPTADNIFEQLLTGLGTIAKDYKMFRINEVGHLGYGIFLKSNNKYQMIEYIYVDTDVDQKKALQMSQILYNRVVKM